MACRLVRKLMTCGLCLAAAKRDLCKLQIRKGLSSKQFSADYHEEKPVIVEGAAMKWVNMGLDAAAFAHEFHGLNVTLRDPKLLVSQSHSAPPVVSLTVDAYIDSLREQKLPVFENKYTALTRAVRAKLDPRGFPVDRVRTTPIVSFGGRHTGVGLHAHGENWLAQIQGRKMWILAAPTEPKKMPVVGKDICGLLASDYRRNPELRRCVLKPGDVLYLPGGWWHGTCNLDDWTLAVGGERDTLGLPAAHLAVIDADTTKLRKLLSKKPALVSKVSPTYGTAAHIAAMIGDVSMLGVLSELGADLHQDTEGLGRPLDVACIWGQLSVVEWLVTVHGASMIVDAGRGIMGMSALHLAAGHNHPEMVRWLLVQPGIVPLALDDRQRIPLHYAAADGRLEIVRELIANGRGGGDVPDYEGVTPSDAAANRGHEEIAKLLDLHRRREL